MATLFKNLIGNGTRTPELTDEMRGILDEIRQERGHCEALVNSARASIHRFQELGEPLARAGGAMDAITARLDGLEQRLTGFERLTSQLQTLDENADRLGQKQRQADARISHAVETTERIHSLVEELDQKVDQALDLKERMGSFLELEPPFRQLQGDADELRVQVAGTTEHLNRLREQHERVMDAHRVALSKMDSFDRRHEELGRSVDDRERRLAVVEKALRGMDDVNATVDDAMRRLGTLRALGEYVAQKTTILEGQRQLVERAVERAEALDQAMREVDSGVRQQQENARSLAALQEQVAALQSLHDQVIRRSDDVDRLQREGDEQIRLVRTELNAARDEARKSVERFDFESSGLESVSHRVTDLRSELSGFEARFASLSESHQAVDELNARTRSIATQLEAVTAEVGRLDEETGKVQSLRRDLDELMRTAREAGELAARIDEGRPAVETALRDFEQLRGANALVKDALERTQVAAAEVARVREEQSETTSWLTNVQQSLGELGERVAELRKLAPTVEFVQTQVHRVNESMSAIESRRDFVEDMQRRMTELATLGGSLDERGRDLQGRMDAAEQRFVGFATRAEEVERMGLSLAAMSASLEEAERDSGEIAKGIAALEARYESIEALAERTRVLRQELDQRQHAVEEAAKDLERATELRQEAAACAQELDERSRQLTTALASADRQTARIEGLASQLEDRAGSLRFVDRRIGQFEERLARWELVEQEVTRSLEQLAARQGTVETLQADIERMFGMAEKTAENVRAITSAHREMEESRTLLDGVMHQLREVRDTTATLDERKRQMAQAEGRLGRAEALLIDVRSSLEVLQSQKVVVDQAVEKAGSLQFLLKQAEATIESLRGERDLATRLRAVAAASQQDDDDFEDQEVAKAG